MNKVARAERIGYKKPRSGGTECREYSFAFIFVVAPTKHDVWSFSHRSVRKQGRYNRLFIKRWATRRHYEVLFNA